MERYDLLHLLFRELEVAHQPTTTALFPFPLHLYHQTRHLFIPTRALPYLDECVHLLPVLELGRGPQDLLEVPAALRRRRDRRTDLEVQLLGLRSLWLKGRV